MNFSLFILEKDKETNSLICKLEFYILFSFSGFSNSYQKLPPQLRLGTVLFSTQNEAHCPPPMPATDLATFALLTQCWL